MSPIDLDDIDRFILSVLQENGELSLRKISKEIKENFNEEYSVTAVKNHLDKLRDQKVIKDIIARIDCSQIGYREMTFFFIRVAPKVPIEVVGIKLANLENTNAIYQITGNYSIICMAKCLEKMDQIALLESIKRIEGIEEVTTEIVMRRFKEDLTVSIPGISKNQNKKT